MEFSNLLSKLIDTQRNTFFDEIIRFDEIKRLFRMAGQSCCQTNISTDETLIAKISKKEGSRLFEDIIGYEHS